MQRSCVFSLLFVVGFFATGAADQPKPSNPMDRTRALEWTPTARQIPPPASQIRDADGAVSAARKICTRPDDQRRAMTASLVKIVRDNTPFLARELLEREAWLVESPNWQLELAETRAFKDACPRTLRIMLDPDDGRVLRILARCSDDVQDNTSQVSADWAEEQMRTTANERYHSFVPGQPLISFQEALEIVIGAGNTLQARGISAQYVLWSKRGKAETPRPVWAITLNEIPPVEPAYPGVVPEHLRNHMRYIVDPATRQWLCASNVPQPDPEDEK